MNKYSRFFRLKHFCFQGILTAIISLPCFGDNDLQQPVSIDTVFSVGNRVSDSEEVMVSGSEISDTDTIVSSSVKVNDRTDVKKTDAVSGAFDKVIVTGDIRKRILESSQSLLIIKPDEWSGTNKSVADVIGAQTGVQTRKYGGTGSFQTVSIRGVEGKEVLVLLDGVPLNSAMGGAVDLGVISPEMLEEIELYKGIVPGSFGGNALGGVINLISKTSLKADNVGLHSAIGSYGNQRYTFEANRFFTENIKVFGALSYRCADNDWSYLDRNRTPLSVTDDTIAKVENHHYENVEVRLYPSYYLKNNRVLVSGVNWSRSKSGIPGLEGSVNRTARNDHDILLVTSRLQSKNTPASQRFVISPEIGYTNIKDMVFWTSLDSSLGTSHGAIYSVPNAFCRINTGLHIVNVSVAGDITLTDNIKSSITLSGRYSNITTSSVSSHLPYGTDWPGNSQEASLAADINAIYPLGKFTPGAVFASSVKAIRTATDGGSNIELNKTVEASDTIEYPWSIRAGVNCGFGEYIKVFANAGKYMSVPALREKFGFNGVVEPNPGLESEDGLNLEAGVRMMMKNFTAECVAFSSENTNGIIILSDGTMSKPMNIGASRTIGVESSLRLRLKNIACIEGRATFQKAENRSGWFNNYGRKLPNEPDITAMGKVEIGPFLHLTFWYWADYKSSYYRDQANTMRIPANTSEYGTLYHNVKASWKATKNISLSVSLCNINTKSFRYEELISGADESGYSWVVFPQNQWNISADILF